MGAGSTRGEKLVAQRAVRRDINRGPGHRQRAVEERLVGLGRDAGGGEFWLVVDSGQRVDADQWMDRRDNERDVAHVGRSGNRRINESAAKLLGVALIERGQPGVVEDLRVRAVAAGDLQLGAAGERASLEAADDARRQRAQIIERLGADDVAGGSVRRE